MDFWELHSIGFVICLAFFPRLTMLFMGICSAFSGGWFWIGWIFAPRLTVAILASCIYWDTNPVLVVFTWLWAMGGESTEKKTCVSCGNKD